MPFIIDNSPRAIAKNDKCPSSLTGLPIIVSNLKTKIIQTIPKITSNTPLILLINSIFISDFYLSIEIISA